MRDEEKLIKELANSFGIQEAYGKSGTSHYDAATGTLYCEGLTISKSTVNKALEYFERQKNYQKSIAARSSDCMDQYLINVVAHNAIQMLIANLKE